MRNQILILIVISFSFLSLSHSKPSSKLENKPSLLQTKVMSCLAAVYTAQKSFYSEHKKYSSDEEKIGFLNEDCGATFVYDIQEDNFEVIALDSSGELLGTVNSDKQIIAF